MKQTINELSAQLCQDHKIHNVISVDRNKINANALVYKLDGVFTLLVANDLSEFVKNFVIAHEVGHIVLNYIHNDPIAQQDIKIETEINLWAVRQLKDHLPAPLTSKILINEFQKSEEKGFKLISKITNGEYNETINQ